MYEQLLGPLAEHMKEMGTLPDEFPSQHRKDPDASAVGRVRKGAAILSDFHQSAGVGEAYLEEVIIYGALQGMYCWAKALCGAAAERVFHAKGELSDEDVLRIWENTNGDYMEDSLQGILMDRRAANDICERNSAMIEAARRLADD